MKNTRAILAAAVLTVLPGATYSQGTPAPADAFLYIIWWSIYPEYCASFAAVVRQLPACGHLERGRPRRATSP